MSTHTLRNCLRFAALAWAACTTAAWSQGRPFTVVSFGGALQDAQREVFFKPFAQQTGIAMTDESWDGGIVTLRDKIRGGSNKWDLVQVESEELLIGCKEGLYEKIDWGRIGGRDSYLPQTVSECGVGAILYDFVLAYDGDRLKGAAAPQTWADFFDIKRFPGKRSLRKGPKTNLEFALLADGVPTRDLYKVLATPGGVDRAFAKLDSIKREIVWWEKGAQPPQLLIAGDVAMASAYNGRISAANKSQAKNLRMSWNNSIYTVDSWVIMKSSPNKAAAEKFLEFAGASAVQKNLPAHIPYGLPNRYATMLVDRAAWENLPTNPDNLRTALQIDDSYWVANVDRLTQRFNAWLAQ